jgi:hypothetical protein
MNGTEDASKLRKAWTTQITTIRNTLLCTHIYTECFHFRVGLSRHLNHITIHNNTQRGRLKESTVLSE